MKNNVKANQRSVAQNKMTDRADIQNKLQNIEWLAVTIEASSESDTRSVALELLQNLIELNGETVERILSVVFSSSNSGADLIDELASDKQIEKILLLHGLHPKSSETRVGEAIKNLEPFLKLNKINAEVTEFNDERVKINLKVSKNDSAKSFQKIIEDAIFDRAPDIPSLEIEVVRPQNFVQIQRTK